MSGILVGGIDVGMGVRFDTGMKVKAWLEKIRKSLIERMDGEMDG